MHKTWQVCPDTGGAGVATGSCRGPCSGSCEDCCWQGKRGLPEPRKFQIKAVKGLLNPFCSLPALHHHSLMLCFKQKLSLWSNYYACEEAASMRRLQKVLANRPSVRHHGWTLSGLAVMATRRLPPLSSTPLPGVIASAPAVATAGACCLSPRSPQARLGREAAPRQRLLSSPLLLGQAALEEAYSRHGGGKALKVAAVQSNRAHLSEPLKYFQSQDGGFCYGSSGFSLMLFSRVCL